MFIDVVLYACARIENRDEWIPFILDSGDDHVVISSIYTARMHWHLTILGQISPLCPPKEPSMHLDTAYTDLREQLPGFILLL